jgi:HTH-type transcriptional regulator/antitoxin HigA
MSAMMTIKPIKTERDYDRALRQVEGLMDAKPDTAEGDALDVLVTLIEAYESKHWAIDLPDPIEAICLRMEQRHLRPKDLIPWLGSSGRVSEVLNRRRALTLPMIRRLGQELKIPVRVLVQEPSRKRSRR